MRGLLLLVFLLALAPLAIVYPFVGALVWSWLSFMSPHRETFGAAADAPVVLIAALTTFVGWAIARKPKVVLLERTALLIVLFALWTGISTITAIDPQFSAASFLLNGKTFLLGIAVLALMTSRVRVQALIWVIAISLGYYAVKGAGFTLATAGENLVLGPNGTAIRDNNTLGAALVMALPLLNYLRSSSRHQVVRWGVALVMLATVIAIVGTYSRGGLFGLSIVALTMWLRSRHKFVLTVGTVAALIVLPMVVPEKWVSRMETIQQYAQDESFDGRFRTWLATLKLVADRPFTGGGYNATQIGSVYTRYSDDLSLVGGRAAHSIYFQVLGDHGVVGLGIYLILIIVGFANLSAVIVAAKKRPQLQTMGDLARMMQVAFIGILSAGALLSMAYYDVFIVLIALSGRLRLIAEQTITEESDATAQGWRR